MLLALFIVSAVLIIATALPLLPWPQWWVRSLEFPRLQLAVLAAIVLLAWLPVWSPAELAQSAIVGLLLVALCNQLTYIVPYTPAWRVQARSVAPTSARGDAPAPAATVSILVANVQMENRRSERLLALVETHRPDVVLVLEPDAWWAQQIEPLAAAYPHSVRKPLDNTYGMLLYARRPLHDVTVRELTRPGIPSICADLECDGGHRVRLHAVHPPPPFPGHAPDSTPRDAELVQVAREIAASDLPTIVAGDLNDVAWSRTTCLFQRLSGMLDPRIGRGMYNTFHARYPFLRWPLDHVFFTPDFHLVRLARLDAIGSDHFPLLVEMTLVPDRADRHDPPPPAADVDWDVARATIETSRRR